MSSIQIISISITIATSQGPLLPPFLLRSPLILNILIPLISITPILQLLSPIRILLFSIILIIIITNMYNFYQITRERNSMLLRRRVITPNNRRRPRPLLRLTKISITALIKANIINSTLITRR